MAATAQNFEIFQGEDEQVEVPVTDGENPVSLTGAAVEWGMWHGDTRLITKATGSGITLANNAAVNDAIVIALEAADTATVAPGYYSHECRVQKGGDYQVVFTGVVTIQRSRTV